MSLAGSLKVRKKVRLKQRDREGCKRKTEPGEVGLLQVSRAKGDTLLGAGVHEKLLTLVSILSVVWFTFFRDPPGVLLEKG